MNQHLQSPRYHVSASDCHISRPCTRQDALERQDLSCMYLAQHELKSVLPDFVHAVYLLMLPYPDALSHPNCFQPIYAYSKANVCSCCAADRPSDDVVVEADLEQAPGVQGNFYIACCAEQTQVLVGIGICNPKCLFSTYSYGYVSQPKPVQDA